MTITHHYPCPQTVCACAGTELVAWKFTSKTVTVAPCSSLIEQGWRGSAVVFTPAQAEAHLPTATVYAHPSALVTMGV